MRGNENDTLNQHFYVHPQHIYVNTSTDAHLQTYKQTEHIHKQDSILQP